MAQFQNHKRGRFNLLYDVVQFIYIIFLGTFQITSVTKPLFVFAFNSLLLLKNFIHYFVEFIPKRSIKWKYFSGSISIQAPIDWSAWILVLNGIYFFSVKFLGHGN